MLLLPILFAASVVASPSLSLLSDRGAVGSKKSPSCKCTANDPCWPSAQDFAKLSKSLSQPVFNVHPPGYFCHDPHFNAALCSEIQSTFTDALWRADQPGASETDNWEFTPTSSCFILGNRTQPCGQGRVPVIGVNATTVSDIQNAVKFAIQHNLKVKVKNTG